MEYTEREIQLVLTMFLRDKNERVIADKEESNMKTWCVIEISEYFKEEFLTERYSRKDAIAFAKTIRHYNSIDNINNRILVGVVDVDRYGQYRYDENKDGIKTVIERIIWDSDLTIRARIKNFYKKLKSVLTI